MIRSKVGHSYIKQTMRDEDADFGGEHSAHFYLRENFYADSGIVTLLIFLQILSEDKFFLTLELNQRLIHLQIFLQQRYQCA